MNPTPDHSQHPPVIVIATLPVRRDLREIFLAAARQCITATRQEAGCLRYDLHESIETEGAYLFVEHWRDKAALEAHAKMPHLRAFVAAAVPCLAAPPHIEAIEGGDRWRLM